MALQQQVATVPAAHIGALSGGPNMGGLLGAVRLIPAYNLVAVPLVSGDQVVGGLQLRDPLGYADVWLSPGSGRFSEELGYTDQGTLYKQKLELEIPRDAPDVGLACTRLAAMRYFVAVLVDHNDVARLVGTPDWPLELSLSLDTGKSLRDRNARQLVLTASGPVPAAYYQSIDIPAGSRRVFSSGFSFGFQRTR